jgi:ABC-type nitrate/sulfonate/bicarbonate transport system substrate-binding protein
MRTERPDNGARSLGSGAAKVILSGIALLVTLAAAACGSSASSQASGGGSTSNAPVSITMASSAQCDPPSIYNLDFYADSSTCAPNSRLAANGIDMTYKTVAGAPVAVAALESGSIQLAGVSPATFFAAVAKGVPLRVVVANYMLFPAETVCTCASAADLAQGTVGITDQGAFDQATLTAYLDGTGKSSVASKIQWVTAGGLGPVKQYAAAGRVSAGTFYVPDAITVMKENPKLHVIITPAQYESLIPILGTLIVTTSSYASSHPDVVEKVQTAFIQENRQLKSSPAVASTIAKDLFPGQFTNSQYTSIINLFDAQLGVNGGQDTAIWQRQIQLYNTHFASENSQKVDSSSLSSMLTQAQLGDVLKRIGKVQSSVDPGQF